MALEELIDCPAETNHTPARRQGFDGERQNDVVDHPGGDRTLGGAHSSAPKHQASTPFCA